MNHVINKYSFFLKINKYSWGIKIISLKKENKDCIIAREHSFIDGDKLELKFESQTLHISSYR